MDHSVPNLTELRKDSLKERILLVFAILLILIFPFTLFLCFRVVKQYKRAVILRYGRLRWNSPAGPGIIWLIPCTDTVFLIDLRTVSCNLPKQEIITKDSVTVTVDAVGYYHVENPIDCLLVIESYKYSTKLLAVATLRNILGQFTLADLLSSRETISAMARQEIDKITMEWGVEIERIEIKDVMLPFDLQKAMASEAEGTRIAKAKIIAAEGEIKTAEYLKEASQVMMKNPKIMLLRYLETLSFISTQQSTSIFFPFPIEIPTSDAISHWANYGKTSQALNTNGVEDSHAGNL